MCSVTDNDFEGSSNECMEPKTSLTLVGVMCKKCQKEKAEIVLRVKDVYCRNCFLDSFTHKFRAVLGKSKMIKPNDRVLVSVSGSQSSIAMLKLVKDGRDIRSPKRLQCEPLTIFIDEGAAHGHTQEQRREIFRSVSRILSAYDIPIYVANLDRCLFNSLDRPVCYPASENFNLIIHDEGDVQIKALFSQMKTLSSKEDLLLKLRGKLLLLAAKELTCSKIFVGDCATDLAVAIMSNLSLGRGAQLPLDVGFCDSRWSNVSILRPMRDFSKKEIAYYAVFKNIESVCIPSLTTKVDPFTCIQKLTEKFVMGLQNDFPSTVSTIFRTADKLSVERTGNLEPEACILCCAPLDTSKQLSSSLQATEFSLHVSSAKLHSIVEKSDNLVSPNCEKSAPDGCCNTRKQLCSCDRGKSQKLDYQQIKNCLCYGCRLIVKEMDTLESLPNELIQLAKKEIMQKQLREEIQDFLL